MCPLIWTIHIHGFATLTSVDVDVLNLYHFFLLFFPNNFFLNRFDLSINFIPYLQIIHLSAFSYNFFLTLCISFVFLFFLIFKYIFFQTSALTFFSLCNFADSNFDIRYISNLIKWCLSVNFCKSLSQ